ncbi:MAG: PAS domain-containing protein [Psychrobium sp.]
MRNNTPVTDRRIPLIAGQDLVTKTDLQGRITYVNPAFIEVSGFTEQELVGEHHNIVRHPDMPQAAFKNMWSTLEMGRPWVGMVKNRCKNGDYYWVKANVTPLMKGGRVNEYMSVRAMPTEQEVDEAERLYTQLNRSEATLPEPSEIKAKEFQSMFKKWLYGSLFVSALISVPLFFTSIAALDFLYPYNAAVAFSFSMNLIVIEQSISF